MDILDGHGAARHTDPATSQDAAEQVNVSRLHVLILNRLSAAPFTVSEIALQLALPRDSLSPRMKTLVSNGLVEDTGESRNPSFRDGTKLPGLRKQTVWKITDKGREYARAE